MNRIVMHRTHAIIRQQDGTYEIASIYYPAEEVRKPVPFGIV
jgi:hypothetical protein